MSETVVRRGFFPLVTGDEVSVSQAGSNTIISAGDLGITQGGGQALVAGGAVSIHQGGVLALAAGGDVHVEQGGAVAIAAGTVHTKDSFVGVAIAGTLDMDSSRVLLGPVSAAAAGVAFAVVVLLGRLVMRRG